MAFDPKHNSRTITDGRDRAAARAYFYSIGLMKDDIEKPFVSIANTWIGTMPCNFNHRLPPARNVRCIDAGATPRTRSHRESSMIAA